MPARRLDGLEAAALALLAQLDTGDGVPLTRLAKQLDQRVSVLMRTFTHLSDARLGGVAGPGFVRMAEDEGRWRAWITPAGRACQEAAP